MKKFKETLAVIVDNDPLIHYYFCPECEPKLGEKIIAKTGRDGIIIHSIHCVAMKTISFDKLLEAHWIGETENEYVVRVEMKMKQSS